MKIAVILREVVESSTVEFDPRTDALRADRAIRGIPLSDLLTIEAALTLAEAGGRVDLVAWASPAAEQSLREPLALAGGRILRAWDGGGAAADVSAAAGRLAAALGSLGDSPDLVLVTGEDDGPLGEALPAMLAARLRLPVVCRVTAVQVAEGGRSLAVTRRLARGVREELEVDLPAVLALDVPMASPRSAAWPTYEQAVRAEIPAWDEGARGQGPEARSGTGDGGNGAAVEVLGVDRPRPFPQRIPTPDSALPPYERINAIVDAGPKRRGGQLVEGPAAVLAERLVAFLKEHELV